MIVLPQDQQQTYTGQSKQAMQAWNDGSSDFESVNDVHPLAVSMVPVERGGRCVCVCVCVRVEG